jgi:hypothetical protein
MGTGSGIFSEARTVPVQEVQVRKRTATRPVLPARAVNRRAVPAARPCAGSKINAFNLSNETDEKNIFH